VQWQLALAIGLVVGAGLAVPPIFWFIKRAEARARRSERRARAAEHLAEVGTLTGALAHEIRNPLSTLTLNLQLLREDMTRPGQSPEPRVLAKLDTIEQEARRLQTILDDFLKFAGRYEVHLAVQPVNPILEEAVSFYADRLQRSGVQVRTSFAENLPPAAVDAARLKQALTNLVLNAEAAMPEGGELLISSEPDGRNLKIHITDTGAGIPQEALDKIFRPYYSTRPGGTGLGLPMVQRIVREHDGRLEVHSEPGRGTRFTIYLPAAETKPARQGP
jgi:signal transduction histidine kinase